MVVERRKKRNNPSDLNQHCAVLGRFRAARWLLSHDKPITLQVVREKVRTPMGTEFVKKKIIIIIIIVYV
jgi:hypothetical protein